MRQKYMTSWTICKQSAPRSRHNHINTSSLNFYTLDALPGTQPTGQSNEGKRVRSPSLKLIIRSLLVTHTHTPTHLTALRPGLPKWAGTRKVKPIWILLKQETVSGSGISWAICKSAVCTSLQTDNHASTRPLSFLQAGCPSCCPTNCIKALKAL